MTKRRIWGVVSVLVACGGAPSEGVPGPAAEVAAAPRARLPTLALGFDASDMPSIALAQEQLRAEPDAEQAYVALATAFLRTARAEGAAHRAYARDVIEVGLVRIGEQPRLRLLEAMLLLDDHRFEQVIVVATELTAILPHDPTPHLLVGDASLELGRYDQAERAYEAAIDLRPDLRSYNRVGYMRWLYGDFEGAVEALEMALDSGSARDPESMAWCFADLGAMFLRRGQVDPALAAADRALALVPEYAPALSLKGRAMAEQGAHEDAQALLARAAERAPSAESILRLVELDRALSNDEAAAHGLQDAMAMAEHDPRPVAHFLARHGEQPQLALALAEKELQARQNIWSWDTLALAAARAGQLERAREAISMAAAMGTEDAALTLHRALVEMLAGDVEAARVSVEAATKTRPHVDPVLVAELRGRLGAA